MRLLSLALAVPLGGIGVATTANPPSEESRLSWGDQGGGTYLNPILPAENLASARDTLTEELWGDTGATDTKLDVRNLADVQRAGFAFMSGNVFDGVWVTTVNGVRPPESQAS